MDTSDINFFFRNFDRNDVDSGANAVGSRGDRASREEHEHGAPGKSKQPSMFMSTKKKKILFSLV